MEKTLHDSEPLRGRGVFFLSNLEGVVTAERVLERLYPGGTCRLCGAAADRHPVRIGPQRGMATAACPG